MKIYKIRNKTTGLFSQYGLQKDFWTKRGRIFLREGDLKCSLTNIFGNKTKRIPDDWEIVVYELVESKQANVSLKDMISRNARK